MDVRRSAAIGFSMAAIILLLGPYTNYSPSAVDMWFSTGYFTNFSDMAERFGLRAYQVSRLPYILPGVAFYAVFTPTVANFLLNLASYGTSVTALLLIASRRLDARWSIALTCLFAFNSYLLYANLWDYSDGPTIAYFLVGFTALDMARARGTLDARALAIGGSCWMLALLAHLLAAALILPFALYVVFSDRPSLQEVNRRIAWMALAALLSFAPFAIFSWIYFGHWFFIGPEIEKFLADARSPDFLPNMWGTGYGWIAEAYRLAALYGPLLAAVPCLFVKRFRTPEFVSVFATCALGGSLYLAAELCDKVMLRAVYHGTFLLIFSFFQSIALLQAAISASPSPAERSSAPRILFVLAVAIGFIFAGLQNLGPASWPVFGICVAAIPAAILIRRNIRARTAIAAVALAVLLNVSTASDLLVRWIYENNKPVFDAAMQAQSVLTSGILKGEKIRFWHDRQDPQAKTFLAINSLYLWRYRDLTAELPTMSAHDLSWILPPAITLIHLCSGSCPLEARAKLLNDVHTRVVSTHTWEVRPTNGTPFMIAIQRTQPSTDDAPYSASTNPR